MFTRLKNIFKSNNPVDKLKNLLSNSLGIVGEVSDQTRQSANVLIDQINRWRRVLKLPGEDIEELHSTVQDFSKLMMSIDNKTALLEANLEENYVLPLSRVVLRFPIKYNQSFDSWLQAAVRNGDTADDASSVKQIIDLVAEIYGKENIEMAIRPTKGLWGPDLELLASKSQPSFSSKFRGKAKIDHYIDHLAVATVWLERHNPDYKPHVQYLEHQSEDIGFLFSAVETVANAATMEYNFPKMPNRSLNSQIRLNISGPNVNGTTVNAVMENGTVYAFTIVLNYASLVIAEGNFNPGEQRFRIDVVYPTPVILGTAWVSGSITLAGKIEKRNAPIWQDFGTFRPRSLSSGNYFDRTGRALGICLDHTYSITPDVRYGWNFMMDMLNEYNANYGGLSAALVALIDPVNGLLAPTSMFTTTLMGANEQARKNSFAILLSAFETTLKSLQAQADDWVMVLENII